MLCAAVLLSRTAGEDALSHESAAVVFGWPTYRAALGAPHIAPIARSQQGLARIHVRTPVDVEDVVPLGQVPGVPTPPGWARLRAVRPAECLLRVVSSRSIEAALVTADAALRSGLVGSSRFEEGVRRLGTAPGSRVARQVLRFANALAESPLETRGRWFLISHGFGVPDLQVPITGTRGLTYRADMVLDGVVIEADGRVKYRSSHGGGFGTADTVFEEKLREDDLRDLGWEVVRYRHEHLEDGRDLAKRLHRALTRASRGGATGVRGESRAPAPALR